MYLLFTDFSLQTTGECQHLQLKVLEAYSLPMLGQILTVLLAESASHRLLLDAPQTLWFVPHPTRWPALTSLCYSITFHCYTVLWVTHLFPNRRSRQEEPCSGSGRLIKPPYFPLLCDLLPGRCGTAWGMVTIQGSKWGMRRNSTPHLQCDTQLYNAG